MTIQPSSAGSEQALLHYLKGKAMQDDGRVRLDISFDELLMLRAALSGHPAQSNADPSGLNPGASGASMETDPVTGHAPVGSVSNSFHPTQGGDKGEAPSLEDVSRAMCDADLWAGAWDEQKATLVAEGRDWEADARMVRYSSVAPAVAALYAPQPASNAYESASRGDLTKLAAECHRAKWEFDLNGEEQTPSKSALLELTSRAFSALHRIGDMALKLRDASSLPSTEGE